MATLRAVSRETSCSSAGSSLDSEGKISWTTWEGMGVISVIGWSLSNSAAEFVPNLTADCDFLDVAVGCGGVSSSLGVDSVVSSLNSMVPGGEGCRRRGVMEVDDVAFLGFFVDRLEMRCI